MPTIPQVNNFSSAQEEPARAGKCIISFGVKVQLPSNHPQSSRDFTCTLTRLKEDAHRYSPECAFLCWDSGYPPGSPPHHLAPFAFKPFCFAQARAAGHRFVLWLDASIKIKQSLAPLFHIIEEQGYLIFKEDHSVGEYCKDDALTTLCINREESFQLPSCWACAIGLDLANARSDKFLAEWLRLAEDGVTFPGPKYSGHRGFPKTASQDDRVRGHRYDQTAASIIALRLKMNIWQPKDVFFKYFDNDRGATYIKKRRKNGFSLLLHLILSSLGR
jgi:hypothetical protein